MTLSPSNRRRCARLARVFGRAAWLLALLPGLALLTLPPAAAAAPAAVMYITGRVTDEHTHEPIGGAVVSLYRPGTESARGEGATPPLTTTQTLQNGAFVLRVRERGAFVLKVEAPDCESGQSRVAVPHAGAVDLAVKRLPAIPVQLVRADGTPIQAEKLDGTVWALWSDTGGVREASRSIKNGAATLSMPQIVDTSSVKKLLLQVRTERDGVGEARVDGWPTKPVEIKLDPGVDVKGIVQQADGKPAVGGLLFLYRLLPDGAPAPYAEPLSAAVNAAGEFAFTHLAPGPYLLREDLKPTGRKLQWLTLPTADPIVARPTDADWDWSLPNRLLGTRVGLTSIIAELDLAAAATMPTVSGTVTDRLAHKPLAHALVMISPPNSYDIPGVYAQRTADDGSFTVRTPQPGTYELKVDNRGYRVISRTLAVGATGMKDVGVALSPLITFHVKVLGPDEKPATGELDVAINELHAQNSVPSTDTETPDAEGVVKLTSPGWGYNFELAPQDATSIQLGVRAAKLGYGAITLPHWPTDTPVIHLKPALTLHIKTLDRDNQPVAGSWIWVNSTATAIQDGPPSVSVSAQSDAHGVADVTNLPPGDYQIGAQLPDGGYHTREVKLEKSGTQVVLRASDPNYINGVVNSKGPWVSGRVLSSTTHQPLAGVAVELAPKNAQAVFGDGTTTVSTDDGGVFKAPVGGKPGTYTITISQTGYVPLSKVIEVGKKGLNGVVLTAVALPALQVKILDATGSVLQPHVDMGIMGQETSLFATAVLVGQKGVQSTGATVGDYKNRLLTLPLPENLPPGPLKRLVLVVRDERGGCAEVRLLKWPTAPVSVRLHDGLALSGHVRNADGSLMRSPYVRAVRLIPDSGGKQWQTIGISGQPDGSFSAAHLLPGQYQLRTHYPGLGLRYKVVNVTGPQTDVTITAQDADAAPAGFPD